MDTVDDALLLRDLRDARDVRPRSGSGDTLMGNSVSLDMLECGVSGLLAWCCCVGLLCGTVVASDGVS